MSLPLTLAVLDGMVVTVADQTLVVPLTAVVETLKPAPLGHPPAGRRPRLLAIRDGLVPLVDVGRARSAPATAPAFADRATSDAAAAAVAPSWSRPRTARSFALHVGAIQDQRQVVIKSLESNYGPSPASPPRPSSATGGWR